MYYTQNNSKDMKIPTSFWLLTLSMLFMLSFCVASLYIERWYQPLIYRPEDFGYMNSVDTLNLLKRKAADLMDIVKAVTPEPDGGVKDAKNGSWVVGAMNISEEIPERSLREVVDGLYLLLENTSVDNISTDVISKHKALLHGVDSAAEKELAGRRFELDNIKVICLAMYSLIHRLETLPKQ